MAKYPRWQIVWSVLASAHNIPFRWIFTKVKVQQGGESGLAHELGNVSIRFIDKTGKEVAGTTHYYIKTIQTHSINEQWSVSTWRIDNEGTLKITMSCRVVYHFTDWVKDIMKFG